LQPEVGHRLIRHLHRYGIRTAVSALREGAELSRTLLEMSGFDSRERSGAGTVAAGIAHFARRAEQLKALSAINQLRRISRADAYGSDRAALDGLAAELDETRPITAGLHGLRIFAAVEAVGRGQLILDDEMQAELFRLARSDDPAEQLGLSPGASVEEAARKASERWRAQAMIGKGRIAGQRAADVLGVLESLASPPVPVAAHREAVLIPKVEVNADAVRRLMASPLVPAEDRESLGHLLTGTDAAAQVGAPSASAQDVSAFAAGLSTRFRALSQLLTFTSDRRAAQSVCDTYALISLNTANGDSPDATRQ
jgi:hypothetical protein